MPQNAKRKCACQTSKQHTRRVGVKKPLFSRNVQTQEHRHTCKECENNQHES